MLRNFSFIQIYKYIWITILTKLKYISYNLVDDLDFSCMVALFISISAARKITASVPPDNNTTNADTVCEKPSSSNTGGSVHGIAIPHHDFLMRFIKPLVERRVNLLINVKKNCCLNMFIERKVHLLISLIYF